MSARVAANCPRMVTNVSADSIRRITPTLAVNTATERGTRVNAYSRSSWNEPLPSCGTMQVRNPLESL